MAETFRRLAMVCMLAALACVPRPARAWEVPGPLQDLQARLAVATMHAPGDVALEVKDLATGYATAVNAGANMPAASTIKIPVMIEVFEQMALGRFDLNKVLHVLPHDRDWGWGDLAGARTGTPRTVGQLLRLMITESDNTATNMLIRLVGRRRINATMRELGLRSTWLGDDIRSDGDIRSLRSSARDMVTLLEGLARAQIVDEWSSREMLAILAGQHHNGLIPAPLPKGLPIAHKTGTLHDTLNDVGIVELSDEPYIIAVMTTHLPTLDLGRRFIRSVSKIAFSSIERFARWRTGMGLPGFVFGQPLATAVQPRPPDVRTWGGQPNQEPSEDGTSQEPPQGPVAPEQPPDDATPAPDATGAPPF